MNYYKTLLMQTGGRRIGKMYVMIKTDNTPPVTITRGPIQYYDDNIFLDHQRPIHYEVIKKHKSIEESELDFLPETWAGNGERIDSPEIIDAARVYERIINDVKKDKNYHSNSNFWFDYGNRGNRENHDSFNYKLTRLSPYTQGSPVFIIKFHNGHGHGNGNIFMLNPLNPREIISILAHHGYNTSKDIMDLIHFMVGGN